MAVRSMVLALVLGSLLAGPGRAAAESATRQAFERSLRRHFAGSTTVSFRTLQLSPQARARIEGQLGAPLAGDRFIFYVASTGTTIDGYAFLGQERSLRGTFLFAVFFDARQVVSDVEVLRYSDSRGNEIRSRAFLRQFEGHTASGGGTIDMVTGATVSSMALVRGVQRATVLLQALQATVPE